MRSRPFIALRLPEVVHPGETFDVELSLDSATATPIDFVRVTLRYTQTLWSVDRGEVLQARDRLVLGEEVAGPGRLEEGVHRYRASFALPGDVPPTHMGFVAELQCVLHAVVSIPWWPDAKESGEVVVRPAVGPRPKSEPFTSASARGAGAFVEVSLPDRTFAPGDTLTGAVAFGGLGGRRASALEVALVGVERVDAGGQRSSRETHRLSFFRDLGGTREGQEVPFRIEVPGGVAPAFSVEEVSLEYALEAVLEHAGGRVVHRVPVDIGSFAPRAGRDAQRPSVGAARWRAVWARGGERAGLSLREGADGLGLRGVRAGCIVEVAPSDERSASGLGATVRFAEPWGLELQVRPRRALELVGVVTGDPAFDGRFRVRGREDAQVQAALTPALRAALTAFPEVDLDDARARVRSAVGAFDASALDLFLRQVEALAQAIAAAGAALLPPASMEPWLPAWRRFAEESGGSLQVGPMRLTGYLEGERFELATLFKGAAAVGTRVALPLEPASEGAGGGSIAAKEALAAALREQVSWFRDVEGGVISVGPEEIAVKLAAALGHPAAAREVLQPMLALARKLRGERRGGPYR
ncbi:hypothetical protein WMF18_17135 [Sorangium sp. So ce315]|uniref:hypothetical protein n=1 Tax=Sorangium sp. So ce315 TaxID=3133299 RepID=UPI003F645C14